MFVALITMVDPIAALANVGFGVALEEPPLDILSAAMANTASRIVAAINPLYLPIGKSWMIIYLNK